MKRWIHSKTDNIRTIEIVIELETIIPDNNVAASEEYIEEPKNIAKDKHITKKHLNLLNDIIASFDNTIKYYKFPVLDAHQGGDSYSYYIKFEPVTKTGEKLAPIDMIFRIANHTSKSADNSITSPVVRVKQFILDEESFDNSLDLIVEGTEILKKIYEGDKTALD